MGEYGDGGVGWCTRVEGPGRQAGVGRSNTRLDFGVLIQKRVLGPIEGFQGVECHCGGFRKMAGLWGATLEGQWSPGVLQQSWGRGHSQDLHLWAGEPEGRGGQGGGGGDCCPGTEIDRRGGTPREA